MNTSTKVKNFKIAVNSCTLPEEEIRKYAHHILKTLNASPALSGYHLAVEAIVICVRNPENLKGITRKDGLYDMLAEKFNKPKSIQVERSIRTLISNLTKNGNIQAIQKIFGENVFECSAGHPSFATNLNFIAGICNYIIYEQESIDLI